MLGKLNYLVLKDKELSLTNGSGMTDYEYKENLKQYLHNEDNLIVFTGKRTLFRLDPGAKRQLKSFIRENQLTLKRRELENRARLVSYYNTITGTN